MVTDFLQAPVSPVWHNAYLSRQKGEKKLESSLNKQFLIKRKGQF